MVCGGSPDNGGMVTPRVRLLSAPERAVKRELTAALGRGDLDAAEGAVARLGGEVPAELLEPVAMVHLARERWSEAAAALGSVGSRDANLEALRRYAANLAALERHRPAAYAALMAAPQVRTYEIDTSRAGRATITRVEGRERAAVVPGSDPEAHLRDALARVASAGAAAAVGVLGVGDGRLLTHLAAHATTTAYGSVQVVYVLEPDADLVRACLMAHDWSGDGGPIEAERFVWAVGGGWADGLREVLAGEPQLSMPAKFVGQSRDAVALAETCRTIAGELESRDGETRLAVERYYASLPAEALAQAMRGERGRRPRALLITSRYTTVLQYSTRDTAEGLRANGWDARVLIESGAHLRLTGRSIRAQLAAHKPDLVIVLDHLRYEYGDLFPPGLPFACWIQDELSNLTSARAGASIGERDFVWTCAGVTYARDYGYPLEQCVYLEKLTRVPERPARWSSDGEDLAYVSNASQRPEELVEVLTAMAGGDAKMRAVLGDCCEAIQGVYERGGHLHSYSQVRAIVGEACAARGVGPLPTGTRERVVLELFTKLNNALYRQQALRWVAAAAGEMGLRLSLYGQGWERHPDFAAFARGPIAYGADLEALTRRAKINLQILPYSTMHQRLLDGVAAGGFFLVRAHPIDGFLAALMRFVGGLPASVSTVEEARAALRDEALGELTALHARYDVVCEHRGADMIGLARTVMAQGGEPRLRGVPRLDEVTFDDAATFRARLERFIGDGGARAEVWREQALYVERHLTYRGDLPRVLRWMGDRLSAARERPAREAVA